MKLINYAALLVISIVSLTGCQQYQATTQDEINQLQTQVNDLKTNIQVINEQLGGMTTGGTINTGVTLEPGEATNLIVEAPNPGEPVVQITNIEPASSKPPTSLKSELATLSQNPPLNGAGNSRYKGKKYIIAYGVSTSDVQLALTNAGYNPGAIDGKIGSRTIGAIKRFQRAEKLKVDGIVGKQTWTRLVKYL